MNSRFNGLLAITALTLLGTVAGADDRTTDGKSDPFVNWVVREGYAWKNVAGVVLFCREQIATGSHIRISRCVDLDQLKASWQASNTPVSRRPLSGPSPGF